MFVYDPLGQSVENSSREPSDGRIGKRIREIRKEKGLTQGELGEKVGLIANRIQQYENGVRNPRYELCKKMAEVLDVDVKAIVDPKVSSFAGAMYAFFEMEKTYDMKVKRDGAKLSLEFGNGFMGEMNSCLDEWEKECRQVEIELEAATSEEERAAVLHAYKMWKWNFPKDIADRTARDLKELRKAKIEEQMKQLQKELSDLNDEDGE